MKIYRIPPRDTPRVYRLAEKTIQRVLDRSNGETSHESLVKELFQDLKQLWLIASDKHELLGAGITEYITYPEKKVVRIVMLGGRNLKDWESEFEKTMVLFARSLGCSAIEVIGRKGWIRELRKHGYKPTYYHLLKEI